MDQYYELKNIITQNTQGHNYQAVESGHNADDKELKQLLLDEQDSPAVSRPKELDQWFSQVYEYYSQKGLACILTCQVLEILTIGATWMFSAFVMLCIDWTALNRCSECISEIDSICKDTCSNIITTPRGGFFHIIIVTTYLLVLMAYLIHRAMVFAKDLKSWVNMQRLFNDDLGISDPDLQTIEWTVVTHRLISLQHRFPSKFIKEFHDEHDITSRILRKDNYMIALVEGPLQGAMHLDHPWLNVLMGPKCLTHSLEMNIRLWILDRMFDEDYHVDVNFLQNEHSLRQTFYFAGLFNLVLSPFIVVFGLVYFALKNAQRYHADPRSLSTRSWCLFANYTFRKYNELPHCFQRRLNKAVPWAEKYVQQFSSPLLSVYARFASFLFSSLLAVLIALWILNEQMMKLDFQFLGINRNLYWYMGIFAMGLGMVRSFIVQQSSTWEAHEPLLSCISYTNYFPKHWKEMGLNSVQVYNEFTDLFMLNIAIPGVHRSIFVQEMLGVIFTPFILWFVLPDKAADILAFLRECTLEKKAVNSICSFADFSKAGFSRHGAHPGDLNEGSTTNQGAEDQGVSPDESIPEYTNRQIGRGDVHPVDNKFEKSFVGFKANNPRWEPPEQGQQLLSKLMETIELRETDHAPRHRLHGSVHGGPFAPISPVAARDTLASRDAVTAASAAVAFISSSHYLPPEDADAVHTAVFQRYMTYGSLMGAPHGDAAVPRSAANCSGVRWGGAGRAEAVEAEGRLEALSAKRLELDEHLLNVLLMEYSENAVDGLPALARRAPPPHNSAGEDSTVPKPRHQAVGMVEECEGGCDSRGTIQREDGGCVAGAPFAA